MQADLTIPVWGSPFTSYPMNVAAQLANMVIGELTMNTGLLFDSSLRDSVLHEFPNTDISRFTPYSTYNAPIFVLSAVGVDFPQYIPSSLHYTGPLYFDVDPLAMGGKQSSAVLTEEENTWLDTGKAVLIALGTT